MPVPRPRPTGASGSGAPGGSRRRRRTESDRGTATAELAVALPSLVLLAALGVWSVLAVAAHLRCVDAAGVGARALARGESAGAVTAAVSRIAPSGALVHLERGDDLVVVEVRADVRLPGPWAGVVPAIAVGDRAVAAAEDSTASTGLGP